MIDGDEGMNNFLNLEASYCQRTPSRVVVIPAPYERSTSYLKGTEMGPQAIIEASHQVELFDSELGSEPYRRGIYTEDTCSYSGKSDEEALKITEDCVARALAEKKIPVVLGGEHTITLAPLRALSRVMSPRECSLLHFDAHSDMRDAYEGNPLSHASVIRRAHELFPHSYSIGVRAQGIDEREYIQAHQGTVGVLYDHERARDGISVEKALAYLPGNSLYLTIDLDYFAPEIMPAVGTPVPGGGSWYETLHFLRRILHHRKLIGLDLVELRPSPGHEASAFFAAQLIYKVLSYALADEL